MTIIYKINNKKCTLEELISHNKKITEMWNSIIIDRLNYWDSFYLDDLIIKAGDDLEDELYELGYNIYFVKYDNKKYDYNKLLNILRR